MIRSCMWSRCGRCGSGEGGEGCWLLVVCCARFLWLKGAIGWGDVGGIGVLRLVALLLAQDDGF